MPIALKPYPEYKDSGAPWLGQVPEHWPVLRVKNVFCEMDERSGDGTGILLSLTRSRGLLPQTEATNRLASAEDLSKYKVCKRGQLVMNRMQAWSGMFAVSNHAGLASPDYSVFRASDIAEVSYFEHVFKTPLYVDEFARRSKGIGSGFNRLYTPDFGAIPLAIPPREEQAAIAAFLAHADRRINRLIRAKRRLIELLHEQKQAIIHRAVTRGLDPNVRLKPSGIGWLGDVPDHWEVRRIKQVPRILRGKFSHRPRNDPAMYDGPYPFIQTGDVSRTAKFVTTYNQTLNDRGLSVSKVFPSGTLVMTIAANIGDVAVLTFDACFPDSVIGLVPNRLLVQDYLYYVLLSMKQELLREAPVNTQGNLNIERIGALWVPVPPFDEQGPVVFAVEQSTIGLTSAISRARRAIDLLREYRTRLIADVVTGKLDVRGVELPPLDVAEALDDLDSGKDTEASELAGGEEAGDGGE